MNKSHKIPIKYECINCNYVTVNKKDYNKHLTTRKHLMEINGNKLEIKYPQCNICSKVFKSSSGSPESISTIKSFFNIGNSLNYFIISNIYPFNCHIL